VSAIVIANTAYAIDMNMQYVQSSNGLMLPDNTTPIETSAIERTIYGGANFFTNSTSALDWEIEFYEHLAFDYNSFSHAKLTGILNYSFQTADDFESPWFETGIALSSLFGGNSQLSGTEVKLFMNKDRLWSDRISTRASAFLENTWLNEEELSRTIFGASGTAYYDVSARTSLYTNATMEMGKHLFSFSSEMNITDSIAQKAIANSKMSEEFEQDWYSVTVEGLKVNSYFGFNSRFNEDVAIDIAYNYTFSNAADYSASQNKVLASIFVEF
jgi:hypothetical protein